MDKELIRRDQVTLLDGTTVDPNAIDLDDDKVYYGDLGKLALSSSACKLLLESPKKYKYVTLYGNEETKSLVLGRLIHLMVLEPERIDKECTFVDVASRAAKSFKETAVTNGAMTFTRTEREFSEKVSDALLQCEAVLKLLDGAKTEQGALVEYMGLPFRAKADIMNGKHLIDLKTTSGLSGFVYSADKYNYDLQAYLYSQIFGAEKFTFLVVDKGTLDIGIFEATESFLEKGKRKLHNAIDIYNDWFRGADLKEADVSNYVLRAELW